MWWEGQGAAIPRGDFRGLRKGINKLLKSPQLQKEKQIKLPALQLITDLLVGGKQSSLLGRHLLHQEGM